MLDRFRPLLDLIAPTAEVVNPEQEIDAIREFARAIGHEAIYLSFNPLQQTLVNVGAPTVPVFAWEFDDLPDGSWNPDKPMENWLFVLKNCGRCITHSTHAATVVHAAMGRDFPVSVIPAPLPARIERHEPTVNVSPLDIEFTGRLVDSDLLSSTDSTRLFGKARGSFDLNYGGRGPTNTREKAPIRHRVRIDREAVVYTAVFNPRDGRKNWRDMVNGFCVALREENATLVLKVFGQQTQKFHAHLKGVLRRLQPIKCRVVVIDAVLDDGAYDALIKASHYALNASLGEGQCLPLMEFMALGRPAVAPGHTGMLDYLDETSGFPYRSSAEPASWPQDTSHRLTTTRQRVDIEALMNALVDSYAIARSNPARYAALSAAASSRIRAWAGADSVERSLRDLINAAS
ncbi:MAG: glycosyltransferase [Pseudomonadota bacterium]